MAFHEVGHGHRWQISSSAGEEVFMLALIDYFSKWIEADSFTQVRDKEVIFILYGEYVGLVSS